MLLILNGASGTGKTTAAQSLATRMSDVRWVHPDGLWDTPDMEAETILTLAASHALEQPAAQTTIIDCQIRPTAIARVLGETAWRHWSNVVLNCPKTERERRLTLRGFDSASFARIEAWACILRDEAIAAGDLVIDTLVNDSVATCARVEQHLENSRWESR